MDVHVSGVVNPAPQLQHPPPPRPMGILAAQGPLGCGPNSGTVSAYAADRPGAVRDIRLGEPEGTEILLSAT